MINTDRIAPFLMGFLLLSGCSTTEGPAYVPFQSTQLLPKSGSQQVEQWIAEVDQEMKGENEVAPLDQLARPAEEQASGDSEDDEKVSGRETTDQALASRGKPTIPFEINEKVEMWIRYFSEKDRDRFQRFLDRGARYKKMIHQVMDEHQVPREIYYLAMIESGFTTHATSSASAVGVWQFISATGKRYGLRNDYYVDERRDPLRATISAAMYLRDLHNVFQSWYLAMAAYNAGEGRILGAIMRSKTRNFWEMVEKKVLPKETMHYIPKFLAAAIIGHHPEQFGFTPGAAEELPALVSLKVPAPVRLRDIAQITGIPESRLKEHNPNIRRDVTPPGSSEYRVWVLASDADRVRGKLTTIASKRIRNLGRYVDASGGGGSSHRVRRGENLSIIARRYSTTVATLQKLNGLKSTQIYVGQKLAVTGSATKGTVAKYKVKRGDNLYGIAKQFGLTVSQLKQLNRLSRNRIYIGQLLKVPGLRG